MYGVLTPEMQAIVKQHVQGRTVWDLGAGDLGYAEMMFGLGASGVIAVDKKTMPVSLMPGLVKLQGYFHEIQPPGGIDVAFLAWPQNNSLDGLLPLLCHSKKVIYLGSNTGGSACGNVDLFKYLLSRKVLAHVPNRRNSLIVYGDFVKRARRPLPDEWAALHQEQVYSLESATEASEASEE